MTELATATFPDGSMPEVNDVMLIAGNLFAAGQETTARLLGPGAPVPRRAPGAAGSSSATTATSSRRFIEEALRLESPIQGEFRLSRVPTTVGGVDLPAGTHGDAAQRRREPRPARVRSSRRAPARPGERSPAPRVRVRHPHLRGRAARARRGARQLRAHLRPDGRHHDLGGRARPGRRPPLPVHAHLHAPRPRAARRSSSPRGHRSDGSDRSCSTSTVDERARRRRPRRRASATSCARGWPSTRRPPSSSRRPPKKPSALREWQRTLDAARWVGIHWPVEYGGRGASLAQVAVYNEELARADAPPLLGRAGISLVGPTLMAHGTEEQRRRWMPRILSGDDVWCQLFSEPDAGQRPRRRSRRAPSSTATSTVVYGSEGVVVVRALRRLGHRARPHRPGRAEPQGHLDAGVPDGRDGRRGPAAAPDHRRERVQRGLPRRRRGPGRATSSARRTRAGGSRTRRWPTSGARRSSGRSRCSTRSRSSA